MGRTPVLEVLRAAYALDDNDERWLQGVCEAARGTLVNAGMLAYRYEIGADSVHLPILLGDDLLRELPTQGHQQLSRQDFVPIYAAGPQASRMTHMYGRLAGLDRPWLPPALQRLWGERDLADMFGVFAGNHDMKGLVIGFGLTATRSRVDWQRQQRIWLGLANHITYAVELRDRLRDVPAADFDLRGRGDFNEDAAAARPDLCRAAAHLEALHGGRAGDEEALSDLWCSLMAGRWSIVRYCSRGGQVRFLALENPRCGWGLRALTTKERAVVERVARGESNKWIALEHRLSEASIPRILDRALAKLGLEHRAQLCQLASALAPG